MSTVQEIMTTKCATCTILDTIYKAAVKMKEYDTGFIPIVDDGRLVGTVTDRDLVLRGIAEKHPNSTRISDIMTEQIFSILPDTTIEEAAALMANKQIRRLPVVKENQLVGIISIGDLAKRIPSADEAGQALSEISESSYRH